MKATSTTLFGSCLLLILSTCASAWPGASLEKREGLILARQQDSSSSGSSSASSTDSSQPSSTQSESSETSTDSSQTSSGSRASKSGSSGSKASSSHATKTTSIDPRLPPGGVEMVTPALTAGSQYYKVGDYVTFAWNYTSLSVTPTAIDILASCATNNAMYTIATNQTIDGPTGAVTWDTGDYQATASIPLLVATYTLVIHDSSKDITAIPQAGYLAAYEQYQFGMYTPQPYTPINEFKCATCGGASTLEKQAFGILLVTSAITTLAFTWFAGSAGIF